MRLDTADQSGLIAAARAGDEKAFRRLVEPYRRALEVHCYRMLGSAHDAEDLVQETLLRAWRALDRFERRSSVDTWLYRIATNACLDELERRPRRPEPVQPFPDDRLEEAASPVVDPAARYALREGMELAFLTAIQQLPGRQRAVLILRDVLGWQASEAADLLDSTVASVNSALQRARATVDQAMPAIRTPTAGADLELLRRYVDAWERVDIDGLVSLLREDAVLRMPPQPSVRGAVDIVRFFHEGGPTGGRIAITELVPSRANGRPAVAMRRRDENGRVTPHGVMVFEVDDDGIAALDAFIDPELAMLFGIPA
jgi:RNA polymerase sigma-70 factor (ECF subfamily)